MSDWSSSRCLSSSIHLSISLICSTGRKKLCFMPCRHALCFVHESIRWEPWTWFIHRLGCSEKRSMARCKVTWVVCCFFKSLHSCCSMGSSFSSQFHPISVFDIWKVTVFFFRQEQLKLKCPPAETVVRRLRTPRHDSALVLVWPTQQR